MTDPLSEDSKQSMESNETAEEFFDCNSTVDDGLLPDLAVVEQGLREPKCLTSTSGHSGEPSHLGEDHNSPDSELSELSTGCIYGVGNQSVVVDSDGNHHPADNHHVPSNAVSLPAEVNSDDERVMEQIRQDLRKQVIRRKQSRNRVNLDREGESHQDQGSLKRSGEAFSFSLTSES